MIFTFLALILIAGCSLPVGNAIFIRLDAANSVDRMGDRAILGVWIGLLLLLNLLLGASLFLPLSPRVVLSVACPTLLVSLCIEQNRNFVNRLLHLPPAQLVLAFVPLACVSFSAVQVVHWYDSGLYHIQVVKWLSKFGLVPGLALLHSRFGFVSSWFALAAPFNHGPLAGRVASLPGDFCMLMLLWGWTMAFFRIMQGRARGQDWFLLAASSPAVTLITLRWIVQSPSPDLPVMVLTIFIGWAVFAVSDARSVQPGSSGRLLNIDMLPLLLATGAVTIKLSALPLLAITFAFYLFGSASTKVIKKLCAALLVTVAILTPLAAAGLITSGCAFYPVPYFCAELPWSLGSAQAAAESEIVREWARWNGPPPDGATALNWIVPWLQADKVFAMLILLTILAAFLVVLLRWGGRWRGRDGYITATAILGTAFMLGNAPTWRFGLGYLFLLPALLAAMLLSEHSFRMPGWCGKTRTLVAAALLGMLILYFIPDFIVLRNSQNMIAKEAQSEGKEANLYSLFNLLLPPVNWDMEYYKDSETGEIWTAPVVLKEEQAGDFVYYRSVGGEMCWDAPLPCTIEKLEDVRLRSPVRGIAGGFVRTGTQKETTGQ